MNVLNLKQNHISYKKMWTTNSVRIVVQKIWRLTGVFCNLLSKRPTWSLTSQSQLSTLWRHGHILNRDPYKRCVFAQWYSLRLLFNQTWEKLKHAPYLCWLINGPICRLCACVNVDARPVVTELSIFVGNIILAIKLACD